MAISLARKRFRIFLGFLLVLSCAFTFTASYYYVGLKHKRISIFEIAPTAFMIDVYQKYLLSLLEGQDGRHKIAAGMYRDSYMDIQYLKTANYMMTKLADEGHAPSQTYQANILYIYGKEEADKDKALQYYRQAAAQNYRPAIEKLAKIEADKNK